MIIAIQLIVHFSYTFNLRFIGFVKKPANLNLSGVKRVKIETCTRITLLVTHMTVDRTLMTVAHIDVIYFIFRVEKFHYAAINR